MRSLIWILSILFLLSVSSCHTTQQVEKTKSEHLVEVKDSINIRDSVRITDKLKVRDSVRIKDSTVVVVDEQGNVIRTELYRERERYRDLEKDYFLLQEQFHDIYLKLQETRTDTVYIEREQQLTKWEQFRLNIGGWVFGIIIITVMIIIGWIVYRFKKTTTFAHER